MISRRRILALSPFVEWPLVNGTVVRTWHFVNYLARENKLWFGCRGGGKVAPERSVRTVYNSPNRFAQLFHPVYFWKLWRLVRREKVDLIVVIQIWSMIHGLLLKWLTGRPLLFDNHNVEYVRWRRMGSPWWRLVALLERLACHAANRIIVVSEQDRDTLVRSLHVPAHKLKVINNGVDIRQFSQAGADREEVRRSLGVGPGEQEILFFGPLSHGANAQAADIIITELAPRLRQTQHRWKIVVAGADADTYLAKRKHAVPESVIFAGFVEDITALIKSADVVIVPLTAGSGTRFKILEAIAAGRAVISTTVGAEGLDRSVLGDALIIEDDWDAFAHAIEESYYRPRHRPPSPAFTASYDWDHIFRRVALQV
jgi:glycosyltransferase involved in cell wall biosynthesis